MKLPTQLVWKINHTEYKLTMLAIKKKGMLNGCDEEFTRDNSKVSG